MTKKRFPGPAPPAHAGESSARFLWEDSAVWQVEGGDPVTAEGTLGLKAERSEFKLSLLLSAHSQ